MAEKKLVVNAAWCKGCGICVAFCPKNILALEQGKVVVSDYAQCNFCTLCELRCPDYAIFVDKEEVGKS